MDGLTINDRKLNKHFVSKLLQQELKQEYHNQKVHRQSAVTTLDTLTYQVRSISLDELNIIFSFANQGSFYHCFQ